MKFSASAHSAFVAAGLVILAQVQVAGAVEVCKDVWAHSEPSAICTNTMGADYYGWTNGRFGTSGCQDNCDCPDCPTDPPSPESAPTKAPTPTPVSLPQTCLGYVGSWSGDPHFRTFDGLKYDCQGEGEFQVLKSLDSNLEIQGRFVKFRDGARPTVTKSVAFQTGDGEETIQVTSPNSLSEGGGSCAPHVHYGKELKDIPAEGVLIDGNLQISHEDQQGGKLQGFIIYYHDTGVQATILAKKSSANGCVLSVKFCFPYNWHRIDENFVGLLGTPDGVKSNDWMDKAGYPVPVPTSKKDLRFKKSYDWCVKNFCITEEAKSNFVYEDGESFDLFQKCGLEEDKVTEECVVNPEPDIKEVCGTEDFACLIDGCAGGAKEAQNFLETAAELSSGCGKEIYYEDFNEFQPSTYAPDWGWIEKGNTMSPFLFIGREHNKYDHDDSFRKTFKVPAGADKVVIEFLFLEIGKWEGKQSQRGTEPFDRVIMKVDDTRIDITKPVGFDMDDGDVYVEGVKDGVFWNRKPVTDYTEDFGLTWDWVKTHDVGSRDQVHKVEVTVLPTHFAEKGEFTFNFELILGGSWDDERAGVDDLRVTAYGLACDIPKMNGVDGLKYDTACGEQIFHETFGKKSSHDWGTIVKSPGGSYLKMDDASPTVTVSQVTFPAKTDIIHFTFLAFKLGDWVGKCENDKCATSKITVRVGNTDVEISLDTFAQEHGGDSTDGIVGGILWNRYVVTPGIIKIELNVPEDKFADGAAGFHLTLSGTPNGVGVGFDDARAIAYNNKCVEVPTARRQLLDKAAAAQSLAVSGETWRRDLTNAAADDCTCVCPALLADSNPTGVAAPVIMNLYADYQSCTPEAPIVGTLTMTTQSDGRVTVVYDIYDDFNLMETNVYVGGQRLPGDNSADLFLSASDFPYLSDSYPNIQTTYEDIQLFDCHFYVAAHAKICGDFPVPPTPTPTTSPTDSPTVTVPPPTGGSMFGDPHIQTWSGKEYDFHGGCDLLFLDNPSFHNGLGMTIHVRTKIVNWWSYIETAVVRIGNETIEVNGGADTHYFVNGVQGDNSAEDFLFSSLGLKVHLKQATTKQLKLRIDLLNADAVGFEVYKDWVRVNVKMKDMKWKKFEGSVGLMGSYPHGEAVGRDGKTVFTDMNAFGQDWQVRESEPKLFRNVDGPQHPTQCTMPSEFANEEEARRRLGESVVGREDADLACAHACPKMVADCVSDVLATNDVDMAGSYKIDGWTC